MEFMRRSYETVESMFAFFHAAEIPSVLRKARAFDRSQGGCVGLVAGLPVTAHIAQFDRQPIDIQKVRIHAGK